MKSKRQFENAIYLGELNPGKGRFPDILINLKQRATMLLHLSYHFNKYN